MAIARSLLTEDDHLLAEILFNPHSLAELAKITSRLEFLKHIIKAQDGDEAREFFRRLRENIREGNGAFRASRSLSEAEEVPEPADALLRARSRPSSR